MNISNKLQKAIGAFRWADVKAHLEKFPREKLRGEVELVLDVMLRDGYLILRRPDHDKAARRKAFMAAFHAFAAAHGAEDLFAARAGRINAARLTELVYQELLASERTRVLSRLAPDVFVWAVLRECELQARDVIVALQAPHPNDAFVDPVAGKVLVASVGGDVNPDQLSDSMMRMLTATLKMLAYEQRWFAENGAISVPSPVLTETLPREIVRANHFLAEAWSQVERSEGRCRYFNGSVTESEITDEAGARVKVVRFEFPDAGELGMHIAGERVKRIFLSVSQGLDKDPGIRAKLALPEPIPLAPDGFVSLSEASGAMALSHVLFKWVGEVKAEYGGLTVVEWLRGYSLLQKLGTKHLQEMPREAYAFYKPRFLEAYLESAGLSPEKAKVFLRHVTFGKDTDDVFDAPLLRCPDDTFFLVAPAVAAYHPAFVITSRLSSLGCDLSWKGKTLEGDIVGLFQARGIPAAAMKRKIDGQECEVDCLVLWDGILFVFECKNYSLPGDHPQAEFWFRAEQASAARQAKTKAEILSRHPEVVADVLKVMPDWTQVVPVVLNGTPYSLPGPVDDVYYYDASALHRFFESGQIGIRIGDKLVNGKSVSFWAAAGPSASDLLKQLRSPAQVALYGEYYDHSDIEFPVSDRVGVSTIKVVRKSPESEIVIPETHTDEAP